VIKPLPDANSTWKALQPVEHVDQGTSFTADGAAETRTITFESSIVGLPPARSASSTTAFLDNTEIAPLFRAWKQRRCRIGQAPKYE
jgi:hypothetical protein